MLTLRQIVDRDGNHENGPNGDDPDHEEVSASSARSMISRSGRRVRAAWVCVVIHSPPWLVAPTANAIEVFGSSQAVLLRTSLTSQDPRTLSRMSLTSSAIVVRSSSDSDCN